MSTPALNPLVEKIRATHPGAYDDMDDATLTKRVLAKYPQYSDLAAPKIQRPNINVQSGPEGLEADPNKPAHMYAGVPGAQPMNREVTGKDLVPGAIAGGAAATVMGGSLALPLGKVVANYAKNNPIKTSLAIDAARHIPVVGKYVPPMAEYLPFIAGEGKGLARTSEPQFKNPGGPLPEAPPPEAALARGAKPYKDPAAGLGNLPFKPAPVETPVEPSPQAPRPQVKPQAVQSQIERGLGNEPLNLKPNVRLRDQLPFTKAQSPAIPEGHTPVESSALQSYKYDPNKKEFEVTFQGGAHHAYAGVEPDQAAAFEAADSKGKAFAQIKNAPGVTHVRKNGKAVKPASPSSYDPNDLTDILTRSVAQAAGHD